MSNNQIEVPSTGRAGQSTQIEQARALAEVHAMVSMAKQYPRSTSLAWDKMRDACSDPGLAAEAFFRFPQGGDQVTGPTVHLARELAICWGNIDFGVRELSRNDHLLESEMQAWAWDIENVVRPTAGFIVPHRRDVSGGTKPLTTMRDVYNNNANAGARRLRECIYAVLPWRFRKTAEALCLATLERGEDENGKMIPLQDRKDNLIDAFGGLGVNIKQLEDKVGLPEGRWRAADVAHFRVIWKSLKAHETTIELEFPTVFTRAEDIAAPVAEVETKPGTPVKTEQWSEMAESAPEKDAPVVPADYVCDVCTAKGQHFQDACPTLNDSGE
jgi:hypothetical protein